MHTFNLLAIETSTIACSLALASQGTVYNLHEVAAKQHNQLILTTIQALLQQAQLQPQQITHIVFSQGPGSFTGLRLASAITQGIALATNAKVLGLSSLQTTAQTAYRHFHCPRIAIALDAHKGDIYWGRYQLNPTTQCMQAVSPDQLITPDKAYLSDTIHWLGIGDGWQIHSFPQFQDQRHVTICSDTLYPNARDLLSLAQTRLDYFRSLEEALPLPVYLREKVSNG